MRTHEKEAVFIFIFIYSFIYFLYLRPQFNLVNKHWRILPLEHTLQKNI